MSTKTKQQTEKIIKSGGYAHLLRHGEIVDTVDYRGERKPMLRRIFEARADARQTLAAKVKRIEDACADLHALAA